LAYGDVMSAAGDVAAKITARVPDVKRGSLSAFGDIFGGRVDNIHTVTSATAEGEPARLVVVFDEGGTLEVWAPEGGVCRRSWLPHCDGKQGAMGVVLLRPRGDPCQPLFH
jgi:hypothetical protein